MADTDSDADSRPEPEVTFDIQRYRDGDAEARERVFVWLVDEIDRVARQQMFRQRKGHTLQPTALINEALIKLLGRFDQCEWQDRNHLRALATRAMKQVLIDHARRQPDIDWTVRTMGEIGGKSELSIAALLDLEQAIDALEEAKPRLADIVRLRYLGGMTVREIAAELGIGERQTERDWRLARARLFAVLGGDATESAVG